MYFQNNIIYFIDCLTLYFIAGVGAVLILVRIAVEVVQLGVVHEAEVVVGHIQVAEKVRVVQLAEAAVVQVQVVDQDLCHVADHVPHAVNQALPHQFVKIK